MRYPILHEWKCQPVSLCLDCFKQPEAESYDPAAMQKAAQREAEEFRASLKRHLQSRGKASPEMPPPRRLKPVLPRKEMTCPGCGEPIFVSPNMRSYQLKFCSMRCYQRAYRKQRRNTGSTIQWKGERGHQCEACEQHFHGKRRDAKFCSDRCRQWMYRQRARV
jgi:hypothetical protein